MSLTMTPRPDVVLARGRAKMAALYTDRVVIHRDAVEGDAEYVAPEDRVMDPVTFQYPPQARVVVYKGPARIQVKADINSNVVEAQVAEREWTYLTSQMQTPVEVAELARFRDRDTFDGTGFLGDPALIDVDYTATVLVAPHDSALVGRELAIKGPFHKSQGVYRRFRLNEGV